MNKKNILFYLFILFAQFSFAKDIYVSADGSNENGGTSLEDAYADLNKAFITSAHDDIIYVDGTAGVIYHPTAFGIGRRLSIIGINNAIIDTKLEDDSQNKFFNYTHKDVDAYLNVENITFINGNGHFNGAAQIGGGFLINTTGVATFKNCIFKSNSSPKHGGVFAIQQGTINFQSCVFEENTIEGVFNGGAIYAETTLPVEITVSDCLFKNNSIGGNGGAVATLFKDVDSENIIFDKSLKISNSTFYNNSSTKSGGALCDISSGAGTIEIENVTINGNTTVGNAGNCGGLYLNASTVNYLIENSIVYGNTTQLNGNAISDLSINDAASITIKASIFGGIIKNDVLIIEDADNDATSIDEISIYGSVSSAVNENVPELALTFNEADGVISFASDALPINFADASLLTGSDDHAYLTDQLGNVRRVVEGKFDAGAYQLDGVATVEEVVNDNVAPTDPSNITFSNIGETSFDVSWEASTDAVMFGYYEIQLDDTTPITTSALSTSFSGLTLNTEYTVKVKAVDYKGNTSNIVEVKQTTAGAITPVVPTNLQVSSVTATSATVSWESSVASGLSYVVFYDGKEEEVSALTYKLEGLTPGTEYSVTVKSKNATDEFSEASEPLVFSASSHVSQTYYVSAAGSNDNDGLTAETSLSTFLSAYNKSLDSDVIVIDGEIEYSTSIGIQKNLTIRGINNATLDAKNALKFFNFNKEEEGSYLILENIHFKNANGKYNGASVETGGAMTLNSPGMVTISGCTFENNNSSLNGGVITIQNGEIVISKSVFNYNSNIIDESKPNGGVIHLSSTTNSVSLTIDQSVFKNNVSQTHGGVLNVETNEANGHSFDIDILNSTFYGNQTNAAGGVIFLGNKGEGTLDLVNVTMAKNSTLATSGNSGAIRSINDLAVVTINNSLIFDNKSNYGSETEVMSDLSTNGSANFTLNNSIIGAIVNGNIASLNGANYLNGKVSGTVASEIPDLVVEDITENNVVPFASDAIAVNFGSAALLSAKPAHGTYLVDQLDNVRNVVEGAIDIGAYQINGAFNVEDVTNDVSFPSDVANIVFAEVMYNSFEVSWDASTDNVGVAHYQVQLNDEETIDVFGTNYKFEELTAETAYLVKVIAVDVAGNSSNVMSESVTTLEKPTSFPTPVVPSNVSISEISQTSATVTWDNPEVEGLSFEVKVGDEIYETSEFSYMLEGLTANTDYEVAVLSKNEIDEKSSLTEAIAFKTLEEIVDTQKTLYVSSTGNNENDGLSLENAVLDLVKAHSLAANGDKIIIDGTVTHTTFFGISKSLEIVGQNNATLDGGNLTKFFIHNDTEEDAYLKIENISFKNGNGEVPFEGNKVAQLGGAILVKTAGTIDIKNCTFENNTAALGGGALAIQSGTLNIISSSFIGNKTAVVNKNGGAILVNSGQGVCNVNIYQTLFKDNVSLGHGGAMIIEGVTNDAHIFIQNSTIYNNETANAGGAFLIAGKDEENKGTLTLENTTVANNYTINNSGNAGGIRVVNTAFEVLINNSIIFNNKYNYGQDTESNSDISFKVGVKSVINSSIISAVLESDNNEPSTGDGRTKAGILVGATITGAPSLSLNEINADGVVSFADNSLAVGYAKAEYFTKREGTSFVTDQLNNLRVVQNDRIDCGAFQLNGKVNADELENDNAAPTAPSNVSFPSVRVNSITLKWDASTDDVAVSHYLISIGEEEPITTVLNEHTFTDLEELTNYSFKLLAVDYLGNESEIVTVEQETDGVRVPLVPTNIEVLNITSNSARVSWDIADITGLSFVVSLQGEWMETTDTFIDLTNLDSNREYSVTVFTKNEIGEVSAESEAIFFNTLTEEEDPISSIDLNQIQFDAYPNPSSYEMTINVGLNQYAVEVYDTSGRKVYNTEVEGSDFKLKLKTGIYILRVVSNENVLTKRIVFN
ncbi:fibronectin type III domain-containing protein [Flammeovirga kamogawensis]|uniref:Fibronectin type III domain-containing protein n=1 Tax=Flammeovirga kamogawensis TaxID=373891 RepID=A0ABX8H3W2_9BACT|nr:fibronectin type III domain-containing protein [Flammeovirga kamogawensis]MBB6460442.1 putative outer membrane repeat protein [Flammeovirga kamogawensis]QWG10247.1 fibronectin type III domain-containing protein [Flammeovirga kamogawensis]TRX64696.1 T9SS type A sorting domain-containing protein [Flammeovirga kamogawensis]